MSLAFTSTLASCSRRAPSLFTPVSISLPSLCRWARRDECELAGEADVELPSSFLDLVRLWPDVYQSLALPISRSLSSTPSLSFPPKKNAKTRHATDLTGPDALSLREAHRILKVSSQPDHPLLSSSQISY